MAEPTCEIKCQFCGDLILEGKQEIVHCSACDTLHHKDCWDENQGCTTYACKGKSASEPAMSGEVMHITDDRIDEYTERYISPIDLRAVYFKPNNSYSYMKDKLRDVEDIRINILVFSPMGMLACFLEQGIKWQAGLVFMFWIIGSICFTLKHTYLLYELQQYESLHGRRR